MDTTEHDALWQEADECGEVSWQWNDFERQRSIPKRLGQGEARIIELHSGITINIITYQFWRPLLLDYDYIGKEGALLSNFYLTGDRRIINPGIQLEAERVEKPGETCLCYFKEERSIEYFPAEQTLTNLGIEVDLERLRSFGIAWDNAPSPLQLLIEGKCTNSFHQTLNQSTPAMQQVLQQIINCPYQGALKRIYLESQVLELLVLQFHQLLQQKLCSSTLNWRSTDIERLHLAKVILQQQMKHPPTLLDLARLVGLNDFKLKQGFRRLFGTTVFGYLKTCRMEQAQQLLGDRSLSIAEIARCVGYASANQFCHAFKRHVGMTPSDYRLLLI